MSERNGPVTFAECYALLCKSGVAGKAVKPTRSTLRYLSDFDAGPTTLKAMNNATTGGRPPPMRLFGLLEEAVTLPQKGNELRHFAQSIALGTADESDHALGLPLKILDMSRNYLGNGGVIALCQALLSFNPPYLGPPPPRGIIYCMLSELHLPQCGIDTSGARAIYEYLVSPRGAHTLRLLDLSHNEYLALEAGQLFLAALGYVVSDTSSLEARNMFWTSPVSSVSLGQETGAFSNSSTSMRRGHRGALTSRLQVLQLVGTNVPLHYMARIDALCGQNVFV